MSVRLVLAFVLALSALPSISVAAASAKRVVAPSPRRLIELAPNLHLREIGPGAYVVAHEFPFLANSALVEMPDGTFVLAGTPWTPDATATLLHWIRTEHGPRRIVAVDTGYHVDNLGGNRALLDAGIPVYGSDLTVKLLRERAEAARQIILRAIGPQSPAYATHASLQFAPPDHVFPLEQGLTLAFGGEDVRVIYPGPTQAPDKVAVYFPGRKLFFGGCMIVGADRLGNIVEADLRHWPIALQQLRESCPANVVVPGHSSRLEPGLIVHTIDLLRAAAPR